MCNLIFRQLVTIACWRIADFRLEIRRIEFVRRILLKSARLRVPTHFTGDTLQEFFQQPSPWLRQSLGNRWQVTTLFGTDWHALRRMRQSVAARLLSIVLPS